MKTRSRVYERGRHQSSVHASHCTVYTQAGTAITCAQLAVSFIQLAVNSDGAVHFTVAVHACSLALQLCMA